MRQYNILTHQGQLKLTWHEYMACHISPRTILIHCEKLKDLGGLFDTSETKVTFGLKLWDVFGYFTLFILKMLVVLHQE